MNVAVYANPYIGGTNNLCVLSAGSSTIEEAAELALVAQGIPYAIVDSADIPDGGSLVNAMTIDLSGSDPVFGYDLDLAKDISTKQNLSYWQFQSEEALAELGLAAYQLSYALSLDPASRTEDQQIAIDAFNEINSEQANIQSQIDAATTGEELLAILGQLG